ncbi:CinA family protein [Corynebacterium sp. MSK044]|uniref:CinA family protein n=1 Tax=Corynebacterium sp. MSK044 TaxID=3050195 RepID=UPI00254F59F2|nr:CinA family protein [Corynebacterium sp. MSK044]MDK8797308.1 CinA family protein [Corynebacterium sp. MSK044]
MSLASSLIRVLQAHSHTLSFCESLTAGLACATVANVSGASAVLRGGLVTYATDLKGSLAGVPADVLVEHGPVSPVTAEHMARGAQRVCGSDWAVALTGVAGPTPQDGHPVGEVYVAVAGPMRTIAERAPQIAGDRQTIREAAVTASLEMLEREIREWEQKEGMVR